MYSELQNYNLDVILHCVVTTFYCLYKKMNTGMLLTFL